jgi:hypothetical protein
VRQALEREFREEREFAMNQHVVEVSELNGIIATIDAYEQEKEAEARQVGPVVVLILVFVVSASSLPSSVSPPASSSVSSSSSSSSSSPFSPSLVRPPGARAAS